MSGLNLPGSLIYFAYTRNALEYGYKLLGLKEGDEIFYPDYTCDVTLVPSKKLGIRAVFYPVNDQFEHDLETAEKFLTGNTKAFFL